MSDRELLELAAKAADYDYRPKNGVIVVDGIPGNWNPLTDDGDALRLAVKLALTVCIEWHETEVFDNEGESLASEHVFQHPSESYEATRRAIVRAAAEIGKRTTTREGE